MGISTHILDTALGKPAAGVAVILLRQEGDKWTEIGSGSTDADGRCRTLLGESALKLATYKLRFEIQPYFAMQRVAGLYPFVEIIFAVNDSSQHYHIPLLMAANGYTTYRGS